MLAGVGLVEPLPLTLDPLEVPEPAPPVLEPLVPLKDEPLVPKLLVVDGVLLKLPYASWSPPMPSKSRPNDCQAQ